MDATFKKVTKDAAPLYGPRKLIICGLTPEQQIQFSEIVEKEFPALPIFCAAITDLELTVGALAAAVPTGQHPDTSEKLPVAVIMSGVTQAELHELIACYKPTGFPWPLWATLTPTSEKWQFKSLLGELLNERREMAKMQAARKETT
ncbi:DUF3783 domain-containing protein [bacterium]|nr:DUF3783 domain-containing protein [bacterium]